MARKQKQKQRQSQKQSVVVNIHEKKPAKKRRPRKKKEPTEQAPPPVVLGLPKVPPIVVQYTEPASLGPPPAPAQQPAIQAPAPVQQPAIFAAPRQAIPFAQEQQQGLQIPARQAAGEAAERRREAEPRIEPQRREAEVQVEIKEPKGPQARPSAREAAAFAAEQRDIFARQQRPASDILQPAPPVWEQLVEEGPVIAEPVDRPIPIEVVARAKPKPKLVIGEEIQSLISGERESSQTQQAREVRTALQRSERAGADVPLELLLAGKYNLPNQPRRPQPTYDQKERLAKAGRPYKGSPSKKITKT
jgi:hypothetical protein